MTNMKKKKKEPEKSRCFMPFICSILIRSLLGKVKQQVKHLSTCRSFSVSVCLLVCLIPNKQLWDCESGECGPEPRIYCLRIKKCGPTPHSEELNIERNI